MSATGPYPGLRPFQADEVDVFFGREAQIDELLARLDRGRLLAVVGPSGCGKSSVVKAGLIPALQTGFLVRAGARWRVAQMRPGNAPMQRLAEALLDEQALGPERAGQPNALGFLLATLRRGSLGLAEVLSDTPPPDDTQLLMVVDQFEEIFRYYELGDSDEADAFVALLLAAVEQAETPIYVVLTMRSDFIGDCALFEGLPEALNDSQYLTPRMTRQERRLAIEGPAGVFGERLDPLLVNRLLNDMGAEPDQLPRMQHLLMRLWNRRQEARHERPLGVEDYEAAGGFADALSHHADEAYGELDEDGRRIAESLFRSLSERGDDRRDVRRPAKLGEVAQVAGATVEQVAQVVEVFRRPDRSFLVPPADVPLTPETVLDVSHESLIRQWGRLRQWVEEETHSASIYARLAQTAELWREDQAGLWSSPDLDVAVSWKRRQRPTAVWAQRYGGGFDDAMDFLEASLEKRQRDEAAAQQALQQAEAQRRVRQRNRLLTAGLIVAAALLLLAFAQWRRAERQRLMAEAGELVANSRELLQDAPQASLLLAVEALRHSPPVGTPRVRALQTLQEGLTLSTGSRLEGSYGAMTTLAVDRFGRHLAGAGKSGKVWLWDLASDSEPSALSGHDGPVNAVAFDPAGQFLASAGSDGSVRIWPVEGGKEPRVLTGESAIIALAFAPDGQRLAGTREDGVALVWSVVEADDQAMVLKGHNDTVSALAFSPDGNLLATVSEDNSVALWDLSGEGAGEPTLLRGHRGPVQDVTFTHDGAWLITASRDNTARFWSMADTRNRLVLCGHRSSVLTLAVSFDSRWLVTGSSDSSVRTWRLKELTAGAARLPGSRPRTVVASAINPDNCRHLLAESRQTLSEETTLWDIRDTDPFLSTPLDGHRDAVSDLALAEVSLPGVERRFVAAASRDQTVRVWSLEGENPGGSSLLLRGHEGAVGSVVFSPSAPRIYSASEDRSVRAWDVSLESNLLVSLVLTGSQDAIRTLAASSDGKWLAASSDDNSIQLWDLNRVAPPLRLRGHDSSVIALGISPDNRWLASGSEDNTVRLWDLASLVDEGPQPRLLGSNTSSVTHLTFIPDSPLLATAGRDGTGRLWNLQASDPGAGPLILCGHAEAVTDMALSSDRRWLATSSRDGTARLWDLQAMRPILPAADSTQPRVAAAPGVEGCGTLTSGAEAADLDPTATRVLQEHGGPVNALDFAGKDRWLATGDQGGSVRLWALGDAGQEAQVLPGPKSPVVALDASPDGNWLAVGRSDDNGYLYGLPAAADSPARVENPVVLRDHHADVSAVAFSPDGRWLATGGEDGEARLWDLQSEDPAARPGVLYGHYGEITSTIFSIDGRWLCTGSRDHTVRIWATFLWSLPPDELVDLACRVAGRNLSSAEWERYFPHRPYHLTCPQDDR